MKQEQVIAVEQLISALEAAAARNDVEALVALFALDATIESYLVSRIFGRTKGVCRGHAEIRELALAFSKRGTPWGGHEPPIIQGNIAAIEYRSASSDAEPFSVDIIEVRDGKIQSLRAYAGWLAIVASDQLREDNRRKVTMLFDAFNDGGLDVVEDLVSAEYVGARGDQGPAGFKAVVVGLRAAFPDIRYTLDDIVAEGDQVAVRWHWTGTHRATFQGFPATGRTIANTGAGVFRFQGGKIVTAALETDRLGFLEHIGAVSEGLGRGARSAPSRP